MSTKEILEILKCHDNYDAYDSDEFCVEMLEAYEEKNVFRLQPVPQSFIFLIEKTQANLVPGGSS
ncbi:hypothetical protein ABEO75_17210 [Paenibacillus macerans]|uniref:hypothetical protein n=1 Tax=Paenibacillus macerans TaxID=44252 RepID=UPI002E224813|nr:hypothetical protein [Paenibacillus macerans]